MDRGEVMRMSEEKCKEAFIKAGFWPNEVMWAAWRNAWMHGAAFEREACAQIAECHFIPGHSVCGPVFADACGRKIRARGKQEKV